MTISEKVSQIVKSFREDREELFPGFDYNTYDIIRRIYFYQHDKYLECSNNEAAFWNIVTPLQPHFVKNIDFDVKDILPQGKGDTNFYQAWILRIKVLNWAKENNIAIDIDDLLNNIATYGSYIVKLVKKDIGKDIQLCDLRNVAFDQSIESIRGNDFVELHYLTDQEIRAKANIWKNTEEIIEKAKPKKEQDIKEEYNPKKEIWEFWGYKETEENSSKYKYTHQFGIGTGSDEIIAYEEDADEEDFPYYDFHLGKYNGRWLRVGVFERCFKLQERANTVVNENAQATAIASLLLLRSKDTDTKGNVLQGAISGQIINSDDLQQIGLDNRAFNLLLNELITIEKQAQRLLMTPDIMVGENMPSGTPFRGMAVLSNASKTAFKQTRTRIANEFVSMLEKNIIRDLIKGWNKGEIIDIADDEKDIAIYDQIIAAQARIRHYETGGKVENEELAVEAALNNAEKMGRKINIKKGFFNFKYGFTIDPVGETYDKAQQNDAIIQALQLYLSNPVIADTPAFKQLLENNGIPPWRVSSETMQKMSANQNNSVPIANKQDKLSNLVNSNI